MICAWQDLLYLVPHKIRTQVDTLGKKELCELRMRLNQSPELVLGDRSVRLNHICTGEDLAFTVNAASNYSPWSTATAASGYVTGAGGHRVGLCGQAVVQNGTMTGIRNPTSICLRVARDFRGISNGVKNLRTSVLVIGCPGSGKTTYLRDLIRRYGDSAAGSIAVVDERGELFPYAHGTSCFPTGARTDVLTGCSKVQGIDTVLRTMGPSCIAMDEITAEEDTRALIQAAWSGVTLYATAHAASLQDLRSRPIYLPLMESQIFDTLVILTRDKSCRVERMEYEH